MARKCSRDQRAVVLVTARAAAGPRCSIWARWSELGGRISCGGLHVRAGLQSILAVHDDLLTGLQAGIDQGLTLLDQGDLHWPDFDGQVLLDYKRVRAVRSTLNDGRDRKSTRL